jgi:hypothetical protein
LNPSRLRSRLLLLLLTWVCLQILLPSGPALASPEADLQEATRAYNRSDFKRVIKLLRPLLYPKNRFSQQSQTVQAYKLLGISYVFEKNRSEAGKQFLALLSLQPGFRLDPLVYPEAAVEVFEEVKKRNAEKIEAILERERKERERRRQEELKREEERRRIERLARQAQTVVERTVIEHPYWINFIPLGAGQFQNGHRKKGYVLMASQLGLAALSFSAALAVRLEYAGRVDLSPEEGSRADALTTVYLVSGALCAALVAYGIIDALVYHEPRTVRERRYKRKTSSIYLAPALGGRTAGLELGLTF